MRIVTKIITVISTFIILVGVGWSFYIYNSPYQDDFIQSFDNVADDDIPVAVGDETRLIGTWENANQQINLNFDGSYSNVIEADEDSYDDVLLSGLDMGEFKANEEKLLFTCESKGGSTPEIAYFWDFGADEDSLIISNASYHYLLSRNINHVWNYTHIVNYSYEKINITGNLSVKNETNGYLTLNDSNSTVVLVFFEGYNNSNISDFDEMQVAIIAYLYQVCECDFWQDPCLKHIESIQIYDE